MSINLKSSLINEQYLSISPNNFSIKIKVAQKSPSVMVVGHFMEVAVSI